jgi:hypothetical protein
MRVVVIVLAVIVGACLATMLGTAMWAENEFTQPESIVASQSAMLARDARLYYSLQDYPYTVCAYMPVYYLLEAVLHLAGLPTRTAGRLISFTAFLALLVFAWRIVRLYTDDARYAWLAALLAGSTPLLLTWGTVGQVDMLAVASSLAAFYFFSRWWRSGDATLGRAGTFALAALFVKQTMIAAPAAMFVLLLIRRPRTALRFACAVGGVALALVVSINTLLNGRFLLNTVLTNINPFVLDKLHDQLGYFGVALGILLFTAMLGVRAARGRALSAPFLYLALALSVLLLTCAKLGSDSNYQLESAILIIICACISLHALDFFPRVACGSKHWVTLLPIALAMQFMIGFWMTGLALAARVTNEQQLTAETQALRPYLQADGRVISTEVNATHQIRGAIDHEPLIYTLLVDAGRIAANRVQRDISDGRFSTIVLYENVFAGPPGFDAEIPSLPPAHLEAVRKRYRLVTHIPGPRLRGVFVYQPTPPDSAATGLPASQADGWPTGSTQTARR